MKYFFQPGVLTIDGFKDISLFNDSVSEIKMGVLLSETLIGSWKYSYSYGYLTL